MGYSEIPSETFISEANLKAVMWAMIGVNTCFVAARTIARYSKLRKLQLEDYMVFLALAFFLAMASLYLVVIPPMYRVIGVANGKIPLYVTVITDGNLVLKGYFATTMLFWATLWAIKISLLLLFRRLMIGLRAYMRLWWLLLVFTIITFFGCVITEITACDSWFAIGGCSSEKDGTLQKVNLYFSMSVDLLTDVLIMALPMRLLWSLRISRAEKISVACIFGVGILCMIFAVIRVISISEKSGPGQISPTWLALWAVIEDSVAIIVGCLPAFAVVIRKRVPKRPTYSYGWPEPRSQNLNSRVQTNQSIQLKSAMRSATRSAMLTANRSEVHSSFGTTVEGSSSQEHLAPAKGILVTSEHNVVIESVESLKGGIDNVV